MPCQVLFLTEPALHKALQDTTIDSSRGKWTMNEAHNPVQDTPLRVVKNTGNKMLGTTAKALADSGFGYRLD